MLIRTTIIFLIFSGIIAACCKGQQNTVNRDSLKAVLKTSPAEDSGKVTNLLNLSYAITFEDPDSSMKLADEALVISKKLKWQKGTALSLREKGLIYYYQSDFLNAIQYAQQALKEGQSMHHKLFDASVYNNIANIYADMGQHEKAMDYYKKLLAAAQEMNNKTYEMNALTNMGTIYVELTRYDKALESLQKAIAIGKSQNDNNIVALIYNDIGIAYKKKGDVAEAMDNFHMALQLAKGNDNNNAIALSLDNMAQIYAKLEKYDSAQAYATESLTYSKAAKAIQWQSEAYETLSTVYEKQNKSGLALDAYKHFIVLRDSMINDEKNQEITRKEMQFEAEKKEAVVQAEHTAEIKQQKIIKNTAVGAAVILLAGGLFLFIFYKRKRDAVTLQQEAELRAEIGDTEMKALRSQMNPHFIFNSLNSISDYISKNDIKAADVYLTKFAKMMRMILENSEQKEVSLKDDLRALELYIQLESMRMNNKFTYDIEIDESIDIENTLVPPLILQPFVENSIWHGLSAKNGKGHILIQIKKEGKMLHCIVEDNGIGRQHPDEYSQIKANKKSFGMKITKARIDIINKLKNSNAAVNIFDLSEGMRAEVKLPLELSF